MMRRTVLSLVATLAVAAGAGCAAEEPAPANPTWARDVLPILQANCFQCHGSLPRCDRDAGIVTKCRSSSTRFDVFKAEDYAPFEALAQTAVANPGVIALYVKGGEGISIMPPPPARPLSARDIEVLERWAAMKPTPEKGAHAPNRPPRVINVVKSVSQGALRIVLDVEDLDGDQVLGQVTIGGMPVPLDRSGRHVLGPFAGITDRRTAIEVTLHDGWPGGPYTSTH
jgi:hypothetical protein